MAEIGASALWFSLGVAGYSAILAFLGARTGNVRMLASARNGVLAVAGLVTIAVGSLLSAFLTHDFSLAYVARNSSRDTPLLYILSGFWGAEEGSLLFWAWILSLFAALLVWRQRLDGQALLPYAVSVLMALAFFFLLLLAAVESPFTRFSVPLPDGRGLNPLLEDPGMLVHPPLLLVGYVGFSIPYAFAMAALLTRRLDTTWIVLTRRWTLFSWYALGAGIVAGGWWAYRTLGWGGYWGWDPVENSALMPWLVATAYLHSVMIQEKRDMLRTWNVLLIILTFTLSILGTFLTRSGVLVSVHTFAQSPIGLYFLAFLGAVLLGSFGLLLFRWDDLRDRNKLDSLVSRESAFLLNNLLFLAATFVVLLGTLFPILTEALRGTKILVGPPYFKQAFAPIGLVLLLLMGVGPLMAWRDSSPQVLVRNFRWPAVGAALTAVLLSLGGIRRPLVVLALAVVAFDLVTIAQEFHRGALIRVRRWQEPYWQAMWRITVRQRRRYGGYLVHLAVLVIVVGVIGSHAYVTEKEATLRAGESLHVGRYTITFQDISRRNTSDREVVIATVAVANEGHPAGLLKPERSYYPRYQQPLSRPAIRSTLREDLYLVLTSMDEDGRAVFRVWVNPLVRWIWLGGVLFTFGVLVAAWPERRRALGKPGDELVRAYERIREIELDYATGKLAEEDYLRLLRGAQRLAVGLLRQEAASPDSGNAPRHEGTGREAPGWSDGQLP